MCIRDSFYCIVAMYSQFVVWFSYQFFFTSSRFALELLYPSLCKSNSVRARIHVLRLLYPYFLLTNWIGIFVRLVLVGYPQILLMTSSTVYVWLPWLFCEWLNIAWESEPVYSSNQQAQYVAMKFLSLRRAMKERISKTFKSIRSLEQSGGMVRGGGRK